MCPNLPQKSSKNHGRQDQRAGKDRRGEYGRKLRGAKRRVRKHRREFLKIRLKLKRSYYGGSRVDKKGSSEVKSK
jgi:hypothetical protein